MRKEEQNIQRALGTLNIPVLTPIDLTKITPEGHHPDLEEDKQYILKYILGSWRGQFEIGTAHWNEHLDMWMFYTGSMSHQLACGPHWSKVWGGIWLIEE